VAAERRAPRCGVTFVEIIVAVTIVAVIGAVVAKNVMGHADRVRVTESIAILEQLRLAAYRFDSATDRFPRRVNHLHTPITGTETNLCGVTTYSTKGAGAEVTAWQSAARGGPFWEYPTTPTGFPIPIGTVSDTLARVPATAANEDRTFGTMQFVVRNVSDDDVTEINLLVDADNSSTGGAVRWTSVGGGLNTMTWNIPVGGC
jgi:type II secretory pathway pseudopilin PulG